MRIFLPLILLFSVSPLFGMLRLVQQLGLTRRFSQAACAAEQPVVPAPDVSLETTKDKMPRDGEENKTASVEERLKSLEKKVACLESARKKDKSLLDYLNRHAERDPRTFDDYYL